MVKALQINRLNVIALALGGALLCALAAGFFMQPTNAQVDVFTQCTAPITGGSTSANTQVCRNSNTGILFGGGGIWARIIRIVSVVVGAVSVLMVIIGGFRYVLSSGDGSNTKAAKDTILYALVGLVIAILANTIVNFVVNNL